MSAAEQPGLSAHEKLSAKSSACGKQGVENDSEVQKLTRKKLQDNLMKGANKLTNFELYENRDSEGYNCVQRVEERVSLNLQDSKK